MIAGWPPNAGPNSGGQFRGQYPPGAPQQGWPRPGQPPQGPNQMQWEQNRYPLNQQYGPVSVFSSSFLHFYFNEFHFRINLGHNSPAHK